MAILLVSVCIISLWSCKKEETLTTTQKVNNFIHDYFYSGYLWNSTLKTDIDPKNEPDPFGYIDKLIYKEYDRWSFLSNDAESLLKEYEGISTTYGLKLLFGQFTGTKTYFAVIQFVYPNSPAEEAGLKRGDIIVGIDNTIITDANVMNLYNSKSMSVQLGYYADGMIGKSDISISMQSREMYLDPVLAHKVITKGDKKIGYLCFTDFVETAETKLDEVFTGFKAENVTDVVLDLRYNPGGLVSTANYLGSILVSQSALTNKSIYLIEIWNDYYTQYLKEKGEKLEQHFNPDVKVNMDLSHLYVLTSEGTASASEATIVSLKPYLEVVQIGETTHGKYCAASLVRPWIDDAGNLDPDIKNWMMSMVVYKYANSEGFTDFKDGLTPNYEIEDQWYNFKPLGDESDPMLAKAIELITGQQPNSNETKSIVQAPLFEFRTIPVDERKGGMVSIDYRMPSK